MIVLLVYEKSLNLNLIYIKLFKINFLRLILFNLILCKYFKMKKNFLYIFLIYDFLSYFYLKLSKTP